MKKQLFFLISAFNIYAFSNLECPLNAADKQRAQAFLAKHPNALLCLEAGDEKECFSAEVLAVIKKMLATTEEPQQVATEEINTPVITETAPVDPVTTTIETEEVSAPVNTEDTLTK